MKWHQFKMKCEFLITFLLIQIYTEERDINVSKKVQYEARPEPQLHNFV